MTLVLTELSTYGIAMAADTALTQNTPTYDTIHLEPRVYHGAMKLRPIPQIAGGVSAWGEGRVGAVDTDIWLRDFIRNEESHYTDLQSFANLLQNSLNRIIDQDPYRPMGFHLAGFVNTEEGKLPCFHHIHNVTQERSFFASLDRPPQTYPENQYCITRNGDYKLYAELFRIIEDYFGQLRNRGLKLPFPENLQMRAEYLRFQIRTISQIYKLSNIFPWIGGPITTLTISSEGIRSYETREEIVVP